MANKRLIKVTSSLIAPSKAFKADTVEDAYPRPYQLRKKVAEYFAYCDEEKKHYSVPGLGLYLGLRTKVIMNYNPDNPDCSEHKHIIDYALQRIEAYVTDRLFETKGNTKGTEFLLQNTLGYANKSDTNAKTELEINERTRIKQLPDEEVQRRLIRLVPKIDQITKSS